jgi:hypothetical protein
MAEISTIPYIDQVVILVVAALSVCGLGNRDFQDRRPLQKISLLYHPDTNPQSPE